MSNEKSETLTEELLVPLEKKKKSDTPSGFMNAIQIHQYGGIEELIYEVVPIPLVAPDEILIKVHAAGVNPVDWKVREGHMKDSKLHHLPLILGWDVAGTVAYIGILTTRFKEGDMVFARPDLSRNGCYAEYVTVRANEVAFAPNIPAHMAAGIPLTSQTAWMGLFEIGRLKKDQKILIHGASGGVGIFAVQLAKIVGAYVIGTTSETNIDLVKSLGADEVIDYKKEDFSVRLKDLDMVFDTIGGDTQARSWKTLHKNGVLVSTLSVDQKEAAKYGIIGKTFMANSNGARLQEIAGLVDKHMLHVIVDKEFSLQEAKQAHELSQSGKAHGKIILRVSDNPS